MYFNEKNASDDTMRAMITREVHLINEFKVNILIDNNILNSKLFDISMSNKTRHTESCDIIISIIIVNHCFQLKLIHSVKINLISLHSGKLIFIHKISVQNRDYFFESVNLVNIFIYAYLINIKINFILIRNDDNKVLRIFRNFKLNKIIEFEYVNAFQIDAIIADLTMRVLKSNYTSA